MVVSIIMDQTHNIIEWCKAQQIAFSVDLVEAAKQQLRFLSTVDSISCLYDGPAVDRAIYRYKYCWLPLVAKHMECPVLEGPLVIPLDCEWIWHCHRLNPVQYKRDCEKICGKIIGNLNVVSSITEGTSSNLTESIWEQIYVTEPYHLDLDNAKVHDVSGDGLDANVQNTIEYDLVAAVKRQSSFFSKVSKLMKQDDSYFKEAVNRYKAFLHLIRKSGELGHKPSCVPTHDIDLIWHSHQLNPVAYSKDLNAVFGGILDHNDRDTESSGPKKLLHGFVRTKEIWELTYGGCMYSIEGAAISKLGTKDMMTCYSACSAVNEVVREADEMAQCKIERHTKLGTNDMMMCHTACYAGSEIYS